MTLRPAHARPAYARLARPGFALPLVVLVSLVATLLVAFSLDRGMTQSLSVSRQMDRYANHHFTKGIETLIESFSRSVSGRQMSEMLDPDGLAMRVMTDDGVGLKVSFFDAQSTVLEVFDGFGRDDRMMGEGALVRLIEGFGLDEVKAATRKFGPLAVSINSAPEPILHAMLDAALLGDGVERTLTTLMQARRSAAIEGAMTQDEFELALDSAGLEPPLKARVTRVITTQPIIWRFVVEPDLDPSSAGGALVRYEGLAIIAPPSADRGANVPKGAGAVMEMRKVEMGPEGGEGESRTVTGAGGA